MLQLPLCAAAGITFDVLMLHGAADISGQLTSTRVWLTSVVVILGTSALGVLRTGGLRIKLIP